MTIVRWFGRYYSIFLLLAIYELIVRFGLVSPRLLPSLTVIRRAALDRYLANGELIVQAQVTLYRAFAGFRWR